jgi:uncharacterized RDD family membrane protein YckC
VTGGSDIRSLPTPEGVPLQVTLAGIGDRMAALAIDILLINSVGVVLALLMLFASIRVRSAGALALAVLLVAFFILRSFYFPFFELRWLGQTPGKRALRIRVVDRAGGPLRARAVVARNLLRELELFQPMALLAAPQLMAGGFPPWVGLLAGGWLLVFGALPFFNRDHLRGGDLVAGTMVVRAPRLVLLDDLAVAEPTTGLAFTDAQLDVYGAFELQTLEAVLRLGPTPTNEAPLRVVAERIQRRIGWSGDSAASVPPYEFLRSFYAAQRARLEQRLLFGERRARKRSA